MNVHALQPRRRARGTGLVEALVGLAIGMLALLAVYHVYAASEGHKRTLSGASDAHQSAAAALFLLARDLASAGSGIASAATDASGRAVLDACAMLRPIPVLIAAGARPADPDVITVFYAGAASLATPVPLARDATVSGLGVAEPFEVAAPAAFNAGDVIVAVDGTRCTLSAIAPGGVAVDASGVATLAHTPISGAVDATYRAGVASLVNLGPAAALARVRYSVDVAARALRAQQLLPTAEPVNPIVGEIVNLKAHYGIDTDGDGAVDAWQPADGAVWSAPSLPLQPLATLRRILSVRVALVARSPQYEREAVTPGPLLLFDGTVAHTLSANGQHYRYRVLETIVPLRNALWNAS